MMRKYVLQNARFVALCFTGNRGVVFEHWNDTSISKNLADVLRMTSSDSGYTKEFLDDAYHYDTNRRAAVSRMTSFFTPPHDGEYSFLLKASDNAKLFVDGVR